MQQTDLKTALRQSLEQATPRTRRIFGGDNAMSAEDVDQLVERTKVGLISSVSDSGAPHMTGVGIVLVEGRLYFGVDSHSALYRDLFENSDLAMGLMEPPWKYHVLIEGSARFVDADNDELRRVLAAERDLHGWESAIVAGIAIDKVFTWKN